MTWDFIQRRKPKLKVNNYIKQIYMYLYLCVLLKWYVYQTFYSSCLTISCCLKTFWTKHFWIFLVRISYWNRVVRKVYIYMICCWLTCFIYDCFFIVLVLYFTLYSLSDKSQTERPSTFLSVTNEIVLYIQNILAERDITYSEFEITNLPNSCPIE